MKPEEVKFALNQIGYQREFVVIFRKANGEQRKMRCMMEKAEKPPKNPNNVPVMDLDKSAWRSFNIDTVLSLSY